MDQRSRCVGINSYKLSLLSQHSYIHYILSKCMNQSFLEFNLIFMQFSIGKKINLKSGFQNRKPDFGFKTKNRISGFRLTSLLSSLIVYCLLKYTCTCKAHVKPNFQYLMQKLM